jgi:lipoprotein NlpD
MKGVARLVGLLLFMALPCGCTTHIKAPVGERGIRTDTNPGSHRVRQGESLYSIAWKYGLDYPDLAKWNNIRSPYTIYAGQKLRTRPPGTASAAVPTSRTHALRLPAKPVKTSPVQTAALPQAPTTVSGARPQQEDTRLHWRWPAEGRLVRRFELDGSGKKGIAIAGRQDSPVVAAAGGRVVYRGSGLVGYGRLIIVKHNNNYLSAYGHNRELLVNEGDQVRTGQVIARMGSSGTKQVMLHFEIRRNGKPVDPLQLLPPHP